MDILAKAHENDENSDGNIPHGFLYAHIENTGAQTATVNGISLAAGQSKTYPFVGKSYDSIDYTVNGTTLRVLYIV